MQIMTCFVGRSSCLSNAYFDKKIANSQLKVVQYSAEMFAGASVIDFRCFLAVCLKVFQGPLQRKEEQDEKKENSWSE